MPPITVVAPSVTCTDVLARCDKRAGYGGPNEASGACDQRGHEDGLMLKSEFRSTTARWIRSRDNVAWGSPVWPGEGSFNAALSTQH